MGLYVRCISKSKKEFKESAVAGICMSIVPDGFPVTEVKMRMNRWCCPFCGKYVPISYRFRGLCVPFIKYLYLLISFPFLFSPI